jgi:hypothetical protein
MAVAAPVLLGLIVGAVAIGYYVAAGYSSILRPAEYDALTIGQPQDDVAKRLPRMEMIDAPMEGYTPPAGWDCRYYRPAPPFTSNYVYRLCFANGVLAGKAVVQSGSVEPTPEGN